MEFTKMIENEWKNFESEMLSTKSKFEIFHSSWKISELEQFKNYFVDFGAMDMDDKMATKFQQYCDKKYNPEAYNILDDIYGFECGFDIIQWATFDEIHDLVFVFLAEQELD